MFEGIYDDAPAQRDSISSDGTSISGQLYIDATSWTDWYYVDLDSALHSAQRGDSTARPVVSSFTIPTEQAATNQNRRTTNEAGIYTYWFDVWGKGISVNEFRCFMPTEPQPAPAQWTFAVHRNNVRTNGGAVSETQLADISQVNTLTLTNLQAMTYTPDSWTEKVVWTVQAQMLNSLIGSQGIAVNSVLSSWLDVEIPPMPPAFHHNSHVFIVRLADGSFAALQLANYLTPEGAKCGLTINYKYPLR